MIMMMTMIKPPSRVNQWVHLWCISSEQVSTIFPHTHTLAIVHHRRNGQRPIHHDYIMNFNKKKKNLFNMRSQFILLHVNERCGVCDAVLGKCHSMFCKLFSFLSIVWSTNEMHTFCVGRSAVKLQRQPYRWRLHIWLLQHFKLPWF